MLDFEKLEDLFFCIDVLTKVKFSIGENDNFLIKDIDSMLEKFISLSETFTSENDNSANIQSNDIIDIFTGETIRMKKSDLE